MAERCDVLVVGAGPAGLAAAVSARESGARVVVVDENVRPGGQIWRRSPDAPIAARHAQLLERAAGIEVHAGTAVYDGRVEGSGGDAEIALEALRSDGARLELRSATAVLCTGASERFLPFPGWTLPGVLGLGGLQALVKQGLDVRGRRVVLGGSGPLMLAVAEVVKSRGAEVVALVEQAPRARLARFALGLARHPRKLAQAASLARTLRGVPRHDGRWITRVSGGGVALEVALSDGVRLEADYVGVGFGLVPETRLARLLGCRVDAATGSVVVDRWQRSSLPFVLVAGEPNGIGGVDVALAEGQLAGRVAAGAAESERARAAQRRVRSERRFAAALERTFALRDELRQLPEDDTLVCRCEDVAWGAIKGLADARQAKLETRCGMGPCQGRVCGPALETLRGWSPDRVRPPLVPVPFSALVSTGAASSTEVPRIEGTPA